MKIIINDEVIDLEKIYKISNIDDDNGSNKDRWLYFDIYFINKKSMRIIIRGCTNDNNYKHLVKTRNEIIKIWSENKPIPKFIIGKTIKEEDDEEE